MKVLVVVSVDEKVKAQAVVEEVMIPAWSDYARQLANKKGKEVNMAIIHPQKTFTFAPGDVSQSSHVVEPPKYAKRPSSIPKRAISACDLNDGG